VQLPSGHPAGLSVSLGRGGRAEHEEPEKDSGCGIHLGAVDTA
jgi:hypothetical protein